MSLILFYTITIHSLKSRIPLMKVLLSCFTSILNISSVWNKGNCSFRNRNLTFKPFMSYTFCIARFNWVNCYILSPSSIPEHIDLFPSIGFGSSISCSNCRLFHLFIFFFFSNKYSILFILKSSSSSRKETVLFMIRLLRVVTMNIIIFSHHYFLYKKYIFLDISLFTFPHFILSSSTTTTTTTSNKSITKLTSNINIVLFSISF